MKTVIASTCSIECIKGLLPTLEGSPQFRTHCLRDVKDCKEMQIRHVLSPSK